MERRFRGSEEHGPEMKCTCRSHGGFLTQLGLEEAAQRLSLEGLSPRGDLEYIDRVDSVSALVEVEDDFDYDPAHVELNRREIHHGS